MFLWSNAFNLCVLFSCLQPTSDASTAERVVTIKRQPGGGLGISVKGGAEHGIPVLISRVFVGQAGIYLVHLLLYLNWMFIHCLLLSKW